MDRWRRGAAHQSSSSSSTSRLWSDLSVLPSRGSTRGWGTHSAREDDDCRDGYPGRDYQGGIHQSFPGVKRGAGTRILLGLAAPRTVWARLRRRLWSGAVLTPGSVRGDPVGADRTLGLLKCNLARADLRLERVFQLVFFAVTGLRRGPLWPQVRDVVRATQARVSAMRDRERWGGQRWP